MTKFSPRWNPQYTEELRAHLADGNSFQSFAGKIKVNEATLFFWVRTHPEFKAVKEFYKKPRIKMYA